MLSDILSILYNYNTMSPLFLEKRRNIIMGKKKKLDEAHETISIHKAASCISDGRNHNEKCRKKSLMDAVRMDPVSSYVDIAQLLYKYIQSSESDGSCWKDIKKRIDYTYQNLDHCMRPVWVNSKKGNSKIVLPIHQHAKIIKKIIL